jgi:hypothetical protein
MSSADKQPAGGTRSTVAVLLAVVFLTVIGASVGVMLGMRQLATQATLSQDVHPINATSAATTSSGTTAPSDPVATTSPSRRPSATPSPSPSAARSCPEPMEAAVAAQAPAKLTLVLYIETAVAEVWICRASDRVLWYQGHRKSGPDARYPKDDLTQGVNSLLLSHVKELPGDQYEAVNTNADGSTKYTVSIAALITSRPSQSPETQPVIAHYP